MMGFGNKQGEPVQKTSTFEMSPEQRELFNLVMPGIRQFAADVPDRYAGTTVSPFNQLQLTAQDRMIDAAGRQGDIADTAARTAASFQGPDGLRRPSSSFATRPLQFFTSGDVWDYSNPIAGAATRAATRPIEQNFREVVMPSIRSEAGSTGNFGSSRQGVAEGIASGRMSQAVGDTAAKLAADNYKTNVEATLRASGLLGDVYRTDVGAYTDRYRTDTDAALKSLALQPTIQQMQTTPALTMSGVGDVRQDLAQRRLAERAGNFNWNEVAPFLQAKDLMSFVTGMPGGTNISTGFTPPQNMGIQTLGGAATGAALGSMLFPGVGTGIGAAGGALLPWLFQ